MNREQRILDHTKRDATMIVSRKPSNTEGNNGDFAVGNTAQGPMLFGKVKNKWYSFKPRTVPAKQDEIFEGNVYIVPIRAEGTSASNLNPKWVSIDNDSGNNGVAVMRRDVSATAVGNTKTLGKFLQYDTTIKDFSIRSKYDSVTVIIEILSLEAGADDWDEDSGHSATYVAYLGGDDDGSPGGAVSATTVVDTVNQNLDEKDTMYRLNIDKDYIYPKGSFMAMHLSVRYQDGGTVSNMSVYGQLHLEFHE